MENDPLLRARQAAQCVDPTLIPSALITRSETIKCSYQPVQRQNNSTSDRGNRVLSALSVYDRSRKYFAKIDATEDGFDS